MSTSIIPFVPSLQSFSATGSFPKSLAKPAKSFDRCVYKGLNHGEINCSFCCWGELGKTKERLLLKIQLEGGLRVDKEMSRRPASQEERRAWEPPELVVALEKSRKDISCRYSLRHVVGRGLVGTGKILCWAVEFGLYLWILCFKLKIWSTGAVKWTQSAFGFRNVIWSRAGSCQMKIKSRFSQERLDWEELFQGKERNSCNRGTTVGMGRMLWL